MITVKVEVVVVDTNDGIVNDDDGITFLVGFPTAGTANEFDVVWTVSRPTQLAAVPRGPLAPLDPPRVTS
jgi:hypothetical protein